MRGKGRKDGGKMSTDEQERKERRNEQERNKEEREESNTLEGGVQGRSTMMSVVDV